jgi:hypothetical protein
MWRSNIYYLLPIRSALRVGCRSFAAILFSHRLPDFTLFRWPNMPASHISFRVSQSSPNVDPAWEPISL